MKLDKAKVLEFLPHRDPFLFVDTVSEISLSADIEKKEIYDMKDMVDSRVTAHYTTKVDHPIFEGHFPGNPILPGVVQIEMIAQVCSFGFLKMYPDAFDRQIDMALLGVSEAKFRKPVTPGMELVIKTRCLKIRGGFLTSEGVITAGDELVAQASIMASIKIH